MSLDKQFNSEIKTRLELEQKIKHLLFNIFLVCKNDFDHTRTGVSCLDETRNYTANLFDVKGMNIESLCYSYQDLMAYFSLTEDDFESLMSGEVDHV